jgi:hypothetical protein
MALAHRLQVLLETFFYMLKITDMVTMRLYLINIRYIGYEVLRAVVMKSSNFWNIMAWSKLYLLPASFWFLVWFIL